MQKKQTFKHVKEHLEEKFKIKISYGSLVQLCTARNRRKSASCTKVLLRFFKKEQGFYFEVQSRQTLECCILPISKWPTVSWWWESFKSRKRQSSRISFRHHDHPQITCKNSCHKSITTQTDYVTLQVTCYNFPETKNTAERCVGVAMLAPCMKRMQHNIFLIWNFCLLKRSWSQCFLNQDQTNLKRLNSKSWWRSWQGPLSLRSEVLVDSTLPESLNHCYSGYNQE